MMSKISVVEVPRHVAVLASSACRHNVGRLAVSCAAVTIALSGAAAACAPRSSADPQPTPDDQLIHPLPVIVPKPTSWRPKFPFPYDQTKNHVTAADIQAEGEMCQWFTAQWQVLNDQIGRLQFNRISPNGADSDYGVDSIQPQFDIVTANIDQSLNFLAPRVQALTQSQDFAADNYFAIYEGQAFYGLWQELSNVGNGIKARQADWFTGPSYLRMKRSASEIHRSHVCD
jgi:hypothetical protein